MTSICEMLRQMTNDVGESDLYCESGEDLSRVLHVHYFFKRSDQITMHLFESTLKKFTANFVLFIILLIFPYDIS